MRKKKSNRYTDENFLLNHTCTNKKKNYRVYPWRKNSSHMYWLLFSLRHAYEKKSNVIIVPDEKKKFSWVGWRRKTKCNHSTDEKKKFSWVGRWEKKFLWVGRWEFSHHHTHEVFLPIYVDYKKKIIAYLQMRIFSWVP